MITPARSSTRQTPPLRRIRTVRLDHVLASYRLRTLYGDLHTHTSFSDGMGQPADALRQMRARGLDFAAITDHSEWIARDPRAWNTIGQQVADANDAHFVAIRGFEWSSPLLGHCNVWWSSAYTNYMLTGDAMPNFYEWLAGAHPTVGAQVVAGFNHPGRENGCFDDFALVPAIRDYMVTVECFNRSDDYGAGYFHALDAGWHVGPTGDSDHHQDDWGGTTLARTGVLAEGLSHAHIQAALRARRVFATRVPQLKLLVTGNGIMMGSRIALRADEPLLLDVWLHDPLLAEHGAQIECWSNSGRLVDRCEVRGLPQLAWSVLISDIGPTECWFAVRLVRDGEPIAYSSPIWAQQLGENRIASTATHRD